VITVRLARRFAGFRKALTALTRHPFLIVAVE
jgi:hypothetical protein